MASAIKMPDTNGRPFLDQSLPCGNSSNLADPLVPLGFLIHVNGRFGWLSFSLKTGISQ
jgi:hypothetical protein